MKKHCIDSMKSMEEAALHYGILPFFRNDIKGFSIEEMTLPGLLFGGNDGYDGCWEWKGPVILEQTTAYGKFFRRKAGFVSRELLDHFLNFRRAAFPVEEGSLEHRILHIIKERQGATSAELREILFAGLTKSERPKRGVLEPYLQRLQMGGWILIANFEYKYNRIGERYGWGVALYSTPEEWLGYEALKIKESPQESLQLMIDRVASKLIGEDRRLISKILL